MEARKENRILRNPLLVKVAGAGKGKPCGKSPAERELDYHVETGVSAPAAFQPPILALDARWGAGVGRKGHRAELGVAQGARTRKRAYTVAGPG
jgi:hypothetical protein